MIPWLLLKLLPASANILRLDGRAPIYAFLGFCVICSLFIRVVSAPHLKLQLFRVPLACILFLGSVGLNIIATLASGSTAEVFPTARGLFLLVSLLVMIRGRQEARIWFLLLLVGMTLVQAGHLTMAGTMIQDGATFNEYNIDEQRIVGLANSPWTVSYGSVVFIGVCLLAGELFPGKWQQAIIYSAAVLGIANVFFAVTRGACVALLILLPLWIIEKIISRREGAAHFSVRKFLTWGGSGIAVIAVGIVTVSLIFPEEYEYYMGLWARRFAPGLDAENSRWLSNMAGIKMFLENPWTGVGWERAFLLSEEYGATMSTNTHNSIIQAAAEGGVLGLMFSLLFFVIIPWNLFWRYRHVPGSFVFLGAWGAVGVYQMIANNFTLESHFEVLFMWILFLAARGQLAQVKRASFASTRDPRSAPIVAGPKVASQPLVARHPPELPL